MPGGIRHALQNSTHHITGIGGLVCRVHAQLRGLVHSQHIAPGFILNGLYGLLDFLGGAHGFFSQLAHLVGHHGKSAPGLASARRFNGGVEGQQIGLIRHFVDDAHDLTDIAGFFAQPGHGFLELHDGVAHTVNGANCAFHFLFARGGAGA